MNSIKENFLKVKEKIRIAAEKVGKKDSDITLVIAGKNRTVEQLREVIQAGAEIIGENRAQELIKHYKALSDLSDTVSEYSRRSGYETPPRWPNGSWPGGGNKIKWHFIGHLQTNKIKQVINKVDMIQSLDSLRLAQELDKGLKALGKKMPVLVEINTSQEQTKFGILPKETLDFIAKISKFKNLKIQGLMTVGELVRNPKDNRPFFRLLANLAKKIEEKKLPGVKMKYLSSGTSQDFEIAIEEEANIVRVGRSLFES